MRLTFFILVLLFFGVTTVTVAQSRKKKNRKEAVDQPLPPTTLNPEPRDDPSPPRASRKSMKNESRGLTYESEQQYYERMEAVAKARRKEEKMLMKPQYSDPMYFGHKRPPKKHRAGKLKYCKECGIRH